MDKLVLHPTVNIRNEKKGMTTPEVNYIDVTSVVKLCGFNIEIYFFYKQLSMNEDENIFDEQLNDIYYKRTMSKLHETGSKKQLYHFCWYFYVWLWMWCDSVSSIL